MKNAHRYEAMVGRTSVGDYPRSPSGISEGERSRSAIRGPEGSRDRRPALMTLASWATKDAPGRQLADGPLRLQRLSALTEALDR